MWVAIQNIHIFGRLVNTTFDIIAQCRASVYYLTQVPLLSSLVINEELDVRLVSFNLKALVKGQFFGNAFEETRRYQQSEFGSELIKLFD